MNIIDNFLKPELFKNIQKTIMGDTFPWYYQADSNYKTEGLSQLTHGFYNHDLPKRINSPFLELLEPLVTKLNAVGLVRIKANLTYPSPKPQGRHTDYNFKNMMTAIYYINSNNGGTHIEGVQTSKGNIKDEFVNSVENRMVIIPGNVPHVVVRHTDPGIGRFVINFNYYEGEKNCHLEHDFEKSYYKHTEVKNNG
tara:strand:+ start:1275 stop:1862 length:588 start_codon:yes stop_codon:yes gene_type:complete